MEKEKEQKKKSGSLFWSVLGELAFGNIQDTKNKKEDDLMPWEKDAIKNEGYEPHNFEEEELEEDDYYYEDDK